MRSEREAPAFGPAPSLFPAGRGAGRGVGRWLLVIALAVAGCRGGPPPSTPEEATVTDLREVIEANAPELMKIPGVVGVYQGETRGAPCVRIMVVKRTEELEAKLPKRLGGHPVEIEETGEIRPLPGRR